LDKIAALRNIQELDLGGIFGSWDTITNTIIERYITGISNTPWGGLENRIDKWGNLQYLWVFAAILCLIGGISFLKLVLQPKYIQLTPKSIDFLNKKEELLFSVNLQDIQSIELSRSNTIQIIPKKKSENDPIIYIDIISVKSFKKYCIEHKIEINEDSHLVKMLYVWISHKITQLRNR
jgi:hypothetical protein